MASTSMGAAAPARVRVLDLARVQQSFDRVVEKDAPVAVFHSMFETAATIDLLKDQLEGHLVAHEQFDISKNTELAVPAPNFKPAATVSLETNEKVRHYISTNIFQMDRMMSSQAKWLALTVVSGLAITALIAMMIALPLTSHAMMLVYLQTPMLLVAIAAGLGMVKALRSADYVLNELRPLENAEKALQKQTDAAIAQAKAKIIELEQEYSAMLNISLTEEERNVLAVEQANREDETAVIVRKEKEARIAYLTSDIEDVDARRDRAASLNRRSVETLRENTSDLYRAKMTDIGTNLRNRVIELRNEFFITVQEHTVAAIRKNVELNGVNLVQSAYPALHRNVAPLLRSDRGELIAIVRDITAGNDDDSSVESPVAPTTQVGVGGAGGHGRIRVGGRSAPSRI